jgi:lactate dehydrogenase-like 2-hydroxyacid dehydrogenase
MDRRVHVLQVGALPDQATALIREHFVLHQDNGCDRLPEGVGGSEIRGIATTGKAIIGRELISRLPRLEIISCMGAGSDGIDEEVAAARDIAIATTSAVLAADVADLAMGLIINLARDIVGADSFVRSGAWSSGRYPLGTSLAGARVGVVGLGNIGTALARRAVAFDMEIGYFGRSRRPNVPWCYFGNLADMAGWCRFMALCCPGGAATARLVSSDVLRALGPDGYLVNVARGSVVDEVALAEAVSSHVIAGAGLDVFEDEPRPHPGLLRSPRVITLPHIGSGTAETRPKMAHAMVTALETALLRS